LIIEEYRIVINKTLLSKISKPVNLIKTKSLKLLERPNPVFKNINKGRTL